MNGALARRAGAWAIKEVVHLGLCALERFFGPTLPRDMPSHAHEDWHAIAEHEIEVDLEIKRERAGGWP